MSPLESRPPIGLQAWLQLIRVPNLPGAASTVLVGYLMVAGQWQPVWAVALVVAATLLFYVAGLIGNDLADIERDRDRLPPRPVASGSIPVVAAIVVMCTAFLAALTCCCFLMQGQLKGAQVESHVAEPILVGIALLIAILLYDFLLKRWLVSALAMGLCRGLALLLGASAADLHARADVEPGWGVLLAAGSLTLFVTGLTLIARDEAAAKPRRWLIALGVLAQAAGLAGYAWLPQVLAADAGQIALLIDRTHLFLIAVIGFTVLRRGVVAASTGNPTAIRGAVLISLVSLMTLDAAVALLVTGHPAFPLAILGLLGLSLLLRLFASPT
jgi:4-hydroxybenzoate polyprenyltransferase